jgi:hypothetical protein
VRQRLFHVRRHGGGRHARVRAGTDSSKHTICYVTTALTVKLYPVISCDRNKLATSAWITASSHGGADLGLIGDKKKKEKKKNCRNGFLPRNGAVQLLRVVGHRRHQPGHGGHRRQARRDRGHSWNRTDIHASTVVILSAPEQDRGFESPQVFFYTAMLLLKTSHALF